MRNIDIMGIVNLTDDSFYAPSRVSSVDALLTRVGTMVAEGAGIIDLGACSSRPGAGFLSEKEEVLRLRPAVQAVRDAFPALRLSIDTWRAAVVETLYDLIGPFIVNDISAGAFDAAMLPAAASRGLTYVAMHMRGTPATMAGLTDYGGDVLGAVGAYFDAFAGRAAAAGLEDWILDPGFGFAKTVDQNYELLRGLPAFQRFGRPVLVGLSRKSMVCLPLGIAPEGALAPTQVLHFAALRGGASILRVHDVAPARQTLALYRRLG